MLCEFAENAWKSEIDRPKILGYTSLTTKYQELVDKLVLLNEFREVSAQDRFIITMDVKNFFKDEITVTAKQDYVVIEGRQERKCKNGLVVRQFVRRFRLPDGCTPSRMETRLSDSGVLTFIAHRYASEIPSPRDRKLPIESGGCDPQNPCCMPQNPCCMPPNPQGPYWPQNSEDQEVVYLGIHIVTGEF
ncbi:hsp20/alpha crystallin family domain-containing protein [Phthorimaea operculella]|nr:hsp20/alpha crystallin family domain-containing protein [Phthorimaea operculella]